MPSPLLWGDEETVRQRFGSGAARLELTRRPFPQWKYPFGVAETVEHYRRYYGPVNRAFAALDEARQASLRRDLEEVFSKYNAAGDGTMQPDAEFLDVQAVRA